MGDDIFCIDASCFLNLQKQRDLLRVLEELQTEYPNPIKIYIPNIIYETILLPPERKFLQLKQVLKNWKESDTDLEFDDREKEEYVNNTRRFLSEHDPKPVPSEISNLEKIGSASIFKKDVLKKFGSVVGNIVWETISVSEKFGSKVISFGEKTVSFISELGTTIRKGYSEHKKKIKQRSEISSKLLFWIFSMMTETAVATFIQQYHISLPYFPLTQLPLGLLIIANGP